MKKNLILGLFSLFLFVGLTSMAMMDPPENTTCSEQCAELVADGVFSSNGACMSACNTCLNPGKSVAKIAVCFCHQFEDFGILDEEGLNFGQCVNILKDAFGG